MFRKTKDISVENQVLPIVQAGEPVLRQKGRPLTVEQIRSEEIQRLIEQMRETMYAAPGVGLAAPQVGRGLQIAVIEDRAEYTHDSSPEFLAERERHPVAFHVIINPKLTLLGNESGNDKPAFFEGCLSLPGFTAVVPRSRRVRVDCLDEHGNAKAIAASGWYARILQHEIDHLAGALYIDRMKTRTFCSLPMFEANFKGKSMAEIKSLVDWE